MSRAVRWREGVDPEDSLWICPSCGAELNADCVGITCPACAVELSEFDDQATTDIEEQP